METVWLLYGKCMATVSKRLLYGKRLTIQLKPAV